MQRYPVVTWKPFYCVEQVNTCGICRQQLQNSTTRTYSIYTHMCLSWRHWMYLKPKHRCLHITNIQSIIIFICKLCNVVFGAYLLWKGTPTYAMHLSIFFYRYLSVYHNVMSRLCRNIIERQSTFDLHFRTDIAYSFWNQSTLCWQSVIE